MKKKLCKILPIFLILVLLLTGCGSSTLDTIGNKSYKSESSMAVNSSAQLSSAVNGAGFDYYSEEMVIDDVDYEPSYEIETPSLDSNGNPQIPESQRKLIKRVSLSTETKEFDNFLSFVNAQTIGYGGYVETSDVNGNSYYSYRQSRYANLILRVPSRYLDSFVEKIGSMANITSKSESSEDVTLGYLETESRIKSLEIQRDKLLEWMEKAESVDELIKLESRLSEVRYQIEYYGSILRNYDNLVEFSTITLNISEVEEITPPKPETILDRIGQGLSDNLSDIGEGAEDFAVWFVTSLPYLLIWIILILAVILIVRHIVKKNKKKRLAKHEEAMRQYNEAMKQQEAMTQQSIEAQNKNQK